MYIISIRSKGNIYKDKFFPHSHTILGLASADIATHIVADLVTTLADLVPAALLVTLDNDQILDLKELITIFDSYTQLTTSAPPVIPTQTLRVSTLLVSYDSNQHILLYHI